MNTASFFESRDVHYTPLPTSLLVEGEHCRNALTSWRNFARIRRTV
jgi:hypothetical protein